MSNKEQSGWGKIYKNLTKANELGHEDEIMMDHEYDGIRELDNVLPPWWVYGFYITIAISIFYIFQLITNPEAYSQSREYEIEVAQGNESVAQYKKDHPELYGEKNMVLTTDPEDLAKGKILFAEKTCTICHLDDGGGSIGPNLTDDSWILGGGFDNIYTVISKGGRPGKGMVAWESSISPKDRQLLASYVLSLQGTTPAKPKVAEGEVWVEETN